MDLERRWKLRNTLASGLAQVVDDLEQQLSTAGAEELVRFLDTFLPGRSPSPEWSASLDRLVELIWACVPAQTIEQARAAYAAREGSVWQPIVNLLSPEHGDALAARRWRPAGARRAAIVLR